eukprot:3068637-Pyramimonas_sp.AAC.1
MQGARETERTINLITWNLLGEDSAYSRQVSPLIGWRRYGFYGIGGGWTFLLFTFYFTHPHVASLVPLKAAKGVHHLRPRLVRPRPRVLVGWVLQVVGDEFVEQRGGGGGRPERHPYVAGGVAVAIGGGPHVRPRRVEVRQHLHCHSHSHSHSHIRRVTKREDVKGNATSVAVDGYNTTGEC